MSDERLKVRNDEGFYEMRFESIGGFGANLAGKMLAESIVIGEGLNGSNFAQYGSEKKGSPVKVYVRVTDPDREIRVSAPVEEPHLLAIFNEGLHATMPLTAGLVENGTVVVNTEKSPDEVRDMLKLHSGTVYTVDAVKIAVEEKVKLNTVMMGAVCKASGFMNPDAVKGAIRKNFEKKYPKLVASNIKAFDRGFSEMQVREFKPDGRYERVVWAKKGAKLGYKNQPIGGLLPTPGNSREKDLSASREGYVPVYDREKCIDCGRCDVVCPDMCWVWVMGKDKKGEDAMVLKGVDYKYCKGCLRCVKECPKEAIVARLEREVDIAALRVPLFE